MEHFSRLTTRDVDLLFVLSDSSRRGIMTAARIRDLVRELKLNIKKDLLVLNRMAGPLQQDTAAEIKKNHLDLAGIIPSDEEINRFDRNGTPTFRLPSSVPSVQAAWHIFERYIP
jgi:CO dehydrogenase maturation factor